MSRRGVSAPSEHMLRAAPTAGQKVRGQLARLRPDRAMLIDAAFTLALVGIAVFGFRTTYFGWGWAVVGGIGMLVGLLVTWVASAWRWLGLVTALVVAALYLLLAEPVAVRENLIGGFLPNLDGLRTALDMAVGGWKQLLTALAPVDSEGPYMALPFLFGMVGTALTFGIARRWSSAVAALVAPVALLVTSILLGTLTPASLGVQGAAFGLLAIGWAALRAARNRPALQNGAGRTTRALTTAALLGAATLGGFFVGPMLPGADDSGRTVLRSSLVPPFDVTQFASPLAGYRRYTEPNKSKLFDATLLKVKGLPQGVPVRFATLDSFDGGVWGAGSVANLGDGATGSSFRKVGSHIANPQATGEGQQVTATVTIPAGGYDGLWLPTAGAVSGLTFAGERAETLKDELRFNVDTNTGVLTEKLGAGDTYEFTAQVSTTAAPATVELDSGALVDTADLGFVDDKSDAWSGRVDGQWQKLQAIARNLRDGAYTDGGVPGSYENIYLPGHGVRRMTQFFKATQLAGNDEQYASAFALAANKIGVPSRVVMGALPQADGTVKGKDVHAWVEVRTAAGTWQPFLPDTFVPERNKKPNQVQQPTEVKKSGAMVPPPAANNPPSTLQGPDMAQNANQLKDPPKKSDNPFDPDTWPDWLRWVMVALVGPLVLFLLVYGAIRAAKALRRRRRRQQAETARGISSGWREIVDTARDLRLPLPPRATRTEQAAAITVPQSSPAPATGLALLPLAERADSHVFDRQQPTPEQVAAYWADVATARKALRRSTGFWQRLRGDLSLVTFRRSKADRRRRKLEAERARVDAAAVAKAEGRTLTRTQRRELERAGRVLPGRPGRGGAR